MQQPGWGSDVVQDWFWIQDFALEFLISFAHEWCETTWAQADRGVYGEYGEKVGFWAADPCLFKSYFKAPWNWPPLESGKLCLIPACL